MKYLKIYIINTNVRSFAKFKKHNKDSTARAMTTSKATEIFAVVKVDLRTFQTSASVRYYLLQFRKVILSTVTRIEFRK